MKKTMWYLLFNLKIILDDISFSKVLFLPDSDCLPVFLF